MNITQKRRHQLVAFSFAVFCALALCLGRGKHFVSLAWDPHEINCLPELHLAILVHKRPASVDRDSYVFWHASGALSYVAEDFVLKKVAGVPGDHLVIKDGLIYINGNLVAKGLDDAVLYDKKPQDFERSQVIPPNSYFVIGTAAMSNDSRYWGFLSEAEISGKAYRVY